MRQPSASAILCLCWSAHQRPAAREQAWHLPCGPCCRSWTRSTPRARRWRASSQSMGRAQRGARGPLPRSVGAAWLGLLQPARPAVCIPPCGSCPARSTAPGFERSVRTGTHQACRMPGGCRNATAVCQVSAKKSRSQAVAPGQVAASAAGAAARAAPGARGAHHPACLRARRGLLPDRCARRAFRTQRLGQMCALRDWAQAASGCLTGGRMARCALWPVQADAPMVNVTCILIALSSIKVLTNPSSQMRIVHAVPGSQGL